MYVWCESLTSLSIYIMYYVENLIDTLQLFFIYSTKPILILFGLFFPQVSTLWWQPTSTWRGRSVILWFRRTCRASWPSSYPRCPSGWTESLFQPELYLVSLISEWISNLLTNFRLIWAFGIFQTLDATSETWHMAL